MIVVGGEMLVDLVPVPGAPDAQDVQEAPGPDLRPHLGGGPFNVAIAAGRQGAEVAFLSRLSTDAYGLAGLARLAEAGVDASLVQLGEEPTTLAVTQLAPDGSAA